MAAATTAAGPTDLTTITQTMMVGPTWGKGPLLIPLNQRNPQREPVGVPFAVECQLGSVFLFGSLS